MKYRLSLGVLMLTSALALILTTYEFGASGPLANRINMAADAVFFQIPCPSCDPPCPPCDGTAKRPRPVPVPTPTPKPPR